MVVLRRTHLSPYELIGCKTSFSLFFSHSLQYFSPWYREDESTTKTNTSSLFIEKQKKLTCVLIPSHHTHITK